MKIQDYFIKVDDIELSKSRFSKGQFGFSTAHSVESNNFSDFQIGLIGLSETRNSFPQEQVFNTKLVRDYLYQLADFGNLKIVDLGDIRIGNSIADTYACIQDVTHNLIQKGIIPVFFGGTQEMSISIIEALKKSISAPEISFIDALIDYNEDEDFHSKSYLNHSSVFKDRRIIKSILGYQTYFSTQHKIRLIKEAGFNLFRLGAIRNNFSLIEPILRDSDFVSFDFSSIRQSDSPASGFNSPNGLYAEEACQLANIAGLSDKIKVFSAFEINSAEDDKNQSAHLMAQLIWHLFQGFSARKGDYPLRKLSEYKKIFVKIDKLDEEIVFYQNENNHRFWLELPENNLEKEVISCSEADYKAVCMNEIPERIWKRISNTMK